MVAAVQLRKVLMALSPSTALTALEAQAHYFRGRGMVEKCLMHEVVEHIHSHNRKLRLTLVFFFFK